MSNRVFRILPASGLNLRAKPSLNAMTLVTLKRGQAIARLDETVYNSSWWYVFADTPGAGVFVGFVHKDYVERWDEDALTDSSDDDQTFGLDINTPREPSLPSPVLPDAPDWVDGWNPAIPSARRYQGRCGDRPAGAKVSRVIVHITGNRDLAQVVNSFTTRPASAHYLVDQKGKIHQFVSEDKAAWHSGIVSYVRSLYKRSDINWREYKRYFSWHKGYGADAVYLDATLRQVDKDSGQALLVRRRGGGEWPDYAYFDKRWGRGAGPVGFAETVNPNHNSIGIEILGLGSKYPSDTEYSDAMYEALSPLIADICERYNIERSLGNVCGHEDVNPVERWGWDPNSGFDWSRALGVAGL